MKILFDRPENCHAVAAQYRANYMGEYTLALICGDRRTESTGDLSREYQCKELASVVVEGFCINCPNEKNQTK